MVLWEMKGTQNWHRVQKVPSFENAHRGPGRGRAGKGGTWTSTDLQINLFLIPTVVAKIFPTCFSKHFH